LCAAITPGGELVVMAIGAEDAVILGCEWLVNERLLAFETLEAELVPMVVLV